MNNKRFEVALELFEQGQRFNFSDVSFYLDKKNKILEVVVISNWQIHSLTEEIALEEIQRGRSIFVYLIKQNSQFAEIVKSYKPRFSLINDYGTGSVEICSLSNDKLVWR